MLGYTITRKQDELEIQIYIADENYWYRIAYWRFFSFKDNYWMVGDFQQSQEREYVDHFAQFIKFAQKVSNANMYKTEPQEVLEWLGGLRGMTRLVYDPRTDNVTELEQVERTINQLAYKVYSRYDDTFLDYTLGYGETDALQRYQKHGYYRKEDIQYGIRLEPYPNSPPDIRTIEELLAL